MRLDGWMWVGEPGQGYSDLYKNITPRRVRRWGGWGRYFRAIPGRARGLGWRTVHRLQNIAMDVEAVALGFCNHKPYPAQGGYAHWRCSRKRRACAIMTSHRSNNYIWPRSGGQVEYAPIPVHEALAARMATPRRNRKGTPTLRQSRLMRAKIREARMLRDGRANELDLR